MTLASSGHPRRRGDGRLTQELDPGDAGPQDACGVFGVWAPGEDVAKLSYYGIYALQHHVDRLAEDHERARRLAAGLAEVPGIALDAARVETNIVIFDVRDTGLSGEAFAAGTLASHGVRFSVLGPTTVRAVTHLDIPPGGIERALEAAKAAVTGARH